MMIHSFRKTTFAVLASLSLAIAAAGTTPALAMPNNAGGSGTSMDDLKKKGFKCERAGVNFIVCSKPGQKDWYCTDSGECQEVPFKRNTGTIVRPLVNRGVFAR